MVEITKQTAAGEIVIRVSVSKIGAIEDVRAYLGEKQIGSGYAPLKSARTVNGKILVASCGQIGLTAEDVEAIKSALASERSAWASTPEGIRHHESMAKWDRIAERNEQVARESDINKWRDA